MSIILDALRKLDRERLSRPDGPPNIDIEILRADPPVRGKRTQLYFATILLTAVAATVITYAVVVRFVSPSKSLPPAPMNSPAPMQEVIPAPPEAHSASRSLPPVPVRSPASKQPVMPVAPEANPPSKSVPSAPNHSVAPSQEVITASPSHEPARANREETAQESSKIEKPQPSPGETKEEQNVVPGEAAISPGDKGKGAEPIPSGSMMTPPALKITVISWYAEPAKRFAFVNGMMVHEGDVIEEAKIVEIYPNRVRFLHNGQYFEISM